MRSSKASRSGSEPRSGGRLPAGWVLVSTVYGWLLEHGGERHFVCGASLSRETALGIALDLACSHG
jgi:hypothetical protein